MNAPFLITDNFDDVTVGLFSPDVEGIIWKEAVPQTISDMLANISFERLVTPRKGMSTGRDLWKKESVYNGWPSELDKGLLSLDAHINEVRELFSEASSNNLEMPLLKKTRDGHPPCHFISNDPLTLSNQVPHIDQSKKEGVYAGKLGADWNLCAKPNCYPLYKVVASLGRGNTPSTMLIPFANKGEEDQEHPSHYPDADMTGAVQSVSGDIVVLKQYVTVHCGPQNVERRWFTVY